MSNEKILNRLISFKNNLITLKVNSSFAKSIKKILKSKKADFIFVNKPDLSPMAAVMLSRLLSRKFIWIQSFSNPPEPSFWTKLLLNQTDEILVKSRGDVKKLRRLGVEKPKIRILK